MTGLLLSLLGCPWIGFADHRANMAEEGDIRYAPVSPATSEGVRPALGLVGAPLAQVRPLADTAAPPDTGGCIDRDLDVVLPAELSDVACPGAELRYHFVMSGGTLGVTVVDAQPCGEVRAEARDDQGVAHSTLSGCSSVFTGGAFESVAVTATGAADVPFTLDLSEI